MSNTHTAAKKEEKKPDPDTAMKTDAPTEPIQGITIKGSPMRGKKTETRLFQTEPTVKEWLTKDQATEKGFYWAD